MQTLSTYLLESNELDIDELRIRFNAVCNEIDTWLTKKGAPTIVRGSGEFKSRTKDGDGRFTRDRAEVPEGLLEQTRLVERTKAGQIFTTRLATMALDGKLKIYCSLSVENTVSMVSPVPNNPRCPTIVRTLLAQSPDWNLNDTPLGTSLPIVIHGDEGGKKLANDIRHVGRSIPIIVVSEVEGETLWPNLAEELGYDLAALARVVRIDEASAWSLTEELGKLYSCYRGAVRIYWPPRRSDDDEPYFNSTVWTASALFSHDTDGNGLVRFRATLRRLLMSASASSITPPNSYRKIHEAVFRQRLQEIKSRHTADSEELAIARLYITENEELKTQIEDLEAQRDRAVARAEAAEHSLSKLKALDASADNRPLEIEESNEPKPGEVQFYKKVHSNGPYDVLVKISDCGHTSWQASNKADKARKGLERLTRRTDWKSLQHCGTCTGGGVWKVVW